MEYIDNFLNLSGYFNVLKLELRGIEQVLHLILTNKNKWNSSHKTSFCCIFGISDLNCGWYNYCINNEERTKSYHLKCGTHQGKIIKICKENS